jgi:Sulfotransferase family
MAAFALKRWLLERAFRADSFDDAMEAIALHPAAGRLFGSKLRNVLFVPQAVQASGALFIHIPKNAGTSVAQALYGCEVYHRSLRLYRLAAPDLVARSWKFAVLRAPIERFLSAYDFLLAGGGSDVPVLRTSLRRLKGVQTIDGFLDYLEDARTDWLNIDNAARPQSWFITDRSGRIAVDALFTLDRIDEVQEAVHRYGGGRIMHLNRTRRSTTSLTDDQLRRLRRIYASDFALYEAIAGGAPEAAPGLELPGGS